MSHLVPVRLVGPTLQQHVDHVAAAVVGGHVEGGGAGTVPGLHLSGRNFSSHQKLGGREKTLKL